MKKLIYLIAFLGISFTYLNAQDYPKQKLSGLFFADLFYNASMDSGISSLSNKAISGKKDANGFQFRRIYLTYDYEFSATYSTRFRLEADQNANTSDGKIGVFVKDAYLKWKNIFSGSDLIIGIQPTPAFDVSESYWENRFLEKTILDLRGLVSSRDLALSLKGKIDAQGTYNYWIMVGNNSGNRPESDKYKRFYGHLNVKPVKNMNVTLYGDLKVQRAKNDPNSTSSPKETMGNNTVTTALFVGYAEKDKYSFGAEGTYFFTQNELMIPMANSFDIKNKTGIGFSLFGNYYFSESLALLGRFDYFDPNSDGDFKGDSRSFIVAGLKWSPEKNITFSPNVLIENFESIPNGRSIDASIQPRISLFVSF